MTEWFSVPELVNCDGIISVIPGDTDFVDMAELDCSPKWVTSETVVCDSEGIRVGDVIISGTLGEMVVERNPEVPSIPGWGTHGTVVSG